MGESIGVRERTAQSRPARLARPQAFYLIQRALQIARRSSIDRKRGVREVDRRSIEDRRRIAAPCIYAALRAEFG